MTLSARGINLVRELADKLNNDGTTFLSGVGAQGILNHCHNLVDIHTGAASTLRARFGTIAGDAAAPRAGSLRALSNVTQQNPEVFTTTLNPLLGNTNPLAIEIQSLKFLKTVKEDIQYNVAAWANALQSTITKLAKLSTAPERSAIASGILSMKGLILCL